MIEVRNIYPQYQNEKERKEQIQKAYTDMQKMLYNEKKKAKGQMTHV